LRRRRGHQTARNIREIIYNSFDGQALAREYFAHPPGLMLPKFNKSPGLCIEQMGQTLHRVAWELRPASIDELGLSVVLGDYVSEWGRQFEIKSDFLCHDAGLNELPDEVRTTVYRVMQEALTNIAKHAKGASIMKRILHACSSEKSEGIGSLDFDPKDARGTTGLLFSRLEELCDCLSAC